MIKRLVVAIIMFATSCRYCAAQMPDSVKAYIDTALYYMQTKSLYSKAVDWPMTRDSVFIKAKAAHNYKEAFPAIVFAFQQLKDFHGMVANEDTFYRYPPPAGVEERTSPAVKKEFLKGNRFVTGYLNNSTGYLRVPSMNVNNQKAIDGLANRLRDSLCMLLSRNPKGLIIDLRMNTGGNSVPMQSGLAPLFRDSILGYGVDKDNNFSAPAKLRNGVAVDDEGNILANLKNNCVADKSLPVAVLIGASTASSGEILAAYLKQQPDVKLFGENTAGFCNSTEGFLFMNNQGYLLITVNMIADAKKHVYKTMHVDPTSFVKSADNYDNLPSDPTVQAALKWINKSK